jgi:hypothetical protein
MNIVSPRVDRLEIWDGVDGPEKRCNVAKFAQRRVEPRQCQNEVVVDRLPKLHRNTFVDPISGEVSNLGTEEPRDGPDIEFRHRSPVFFVD